MDKSTDPTILSSVLDFWWKVLPVAARRFSRSVARVLADGYYLSGWPLVGAVLPPLAAFLGLLLGWLHPFGGDSYTSTIPAMTLMVAISNLGRALGVWLWLGYTFGDFAIYATGINYRHASGLLAPVQDLARVRIPFLLSDLLLGILLIVIPFISQRLTRDTISRFRVPRALRLTAVLNIQACVLAALVYLWAQAAPTLNRPLYTWREVGIPNEVNITLREAGWQVVLVAVGILVVRFLLEFRAITNAKSARRVAVLRNALAKARPGPGIALPAIPSVLINIVLAPIKAAVMTFLLSGLIENWLQAIVALIVLTFTFILRDVIIPFVSTWTRLVSLVPLAIRFAIGIFTAWLLGGVILSLTWGFGRDDTYWPLMLSTLVSLFVFALLIPGRVPHPKPKPIEVRGTNGHKQN